MWKTALTNDYDRPLQIMKLLIAVPKLALTLTQLQTFLNPHENGLKLELGTILGAMLSISAFPEAAHTLRPDIGLEFFENYETSNNLDLHQAMLALRRNSTQYVEDLHGCFRTLLKKETRNATMEWIGKAIEGNIARSQMNPNRLEISSNGFCFNLSSVLLKLSEPFVDPSSNKAWPHLTSEYVLQNDRLTFSDETRLAISSAELEAAEKEAAERRQGQPPYHFICECFFMTLKALHLGTVKIIQSLNTIARQIHNCRSDSQEIQAAIDAETNPIAKTQLEVQLKRVKTILDRLHREQLCIESIVTDNAMLTDLNAFYRLVAMWLARLTPMTSSAAFQVPLPDPVPMEFAILPEFFLEDLLEVLIHTGRVAPSVLETISLQETVIFFMALMGSPNYVKNPYLRTKLSEVLRICLPESVKQHPAMRRRPEILAFVFENHPIILKHLVPCLLQLYVDIEFTGRHAQFYEKFQMRASISEVLEYLWDIKEHNDAWKEVAEAEGGRGFYLRFCNMLVNDSIFLLDESLKKLEEIREIETLMDDQQEWNRLTQEERHDRERDHRAYGTNFSKRPFVTFCVCRG